ncbi:MAG: hypothetical protein ACREQ5_31265 [Candidatus Dormibacteria bacterium]
MPEMHRLARRERAVKRDADCLSGVAQLFEVRRTHHGGDGEMQGPAEIACQP